MSETAANHELDEPETQGTVAERASTRVIEAVAEATDGDPLDMEPLYDVVDPEALDCLFATAVTGHVSFQYDGHDVTVHSDGRVLVDDAGCDR